MSVIIRLQNLPWSANALDIRQFFHGLSIPEGGVHIVGGEQGDAFIAFSTDEDARQAFSRTNGKIKEVQISLMLSSRTEMQKVIEAARTKSYAAFMPTPAAQAPLPAAVPAMLPSAVPDLLTKASSRERDAKPDSKRDRKRSRSRSRDRKDRDRRRYRDRSRSRSRDRRRRRDRSRSRGRSRSRDRKPRDARKRSPDAKTKPFSPEIWMNSQNSNDAPAVFPTNGRSFPQNFPINNWQQPLAENGGSGSFLENTMNRQVQQQQQQQQQQNNQFNQPRRFPRNNFQRQDDYPVERDPLPNCCVKLQPFYGGYGDVRRFFQGSFISNVGIKFINDEFGHRTGIVFIQFGHPHGKSEALHRSGDMLNGVKVEVTHIEDEDFEEAIDRYQPENYVPNNDANDPRSHKFRSKNITKYFNKNEDQLTDFSCLIVEDLPTYVKEQDILKLFSPRPLLSLFLTPKSRGGHIAYVKFGSSEDAKEALDEKSHIVEGKAVTVRACDDLEFESISQQHNVDLDGGGGGKSSPILETLDTDCINVTLLPLQTNNIEITDFFSDVGVRPTKIHLMSNRLGFTGQAFCEFKSNEDAAKAFKKDNASFGPNHVSIVPIPREEMEMIVNQSPHPQQQPLLPRGPMMNQNRPFFLRNTYDGLPRGGGGGGPRFMGHRGPRPRFMNAVAAPSDDAPPGCTVFMDNVPYKAGTNEILDFFDGYDVTNNVCRRFNPNNTPSAEAKVIFNTPEEAFRAVQEKNGQKIWDRSIYLKQV